MWLGSTVPSKYARQHSGGGQATKAFIGCYWSKLFCL
jgi:hypothetical protein